MRKRPVALIASDLHLSSKCPPARSRELDWFKCMRTALLRLNQLQEKLDVPVIWAGDIFHKWNSSAELINFAIDAMPSVNWAIPGQHDLPFHNADLIHKSAYWTLVRAKRIRHLEATKIVRLSSKVSIVSFPWGAPLRQRPASINHIAVAIVHKYCWMGDHRHAKADHKSNCRQYDKQLAGFNTIIFGDNHRPFTRQPSSTRPLIFNCGGFMQRNADDDFVPRFGVLYDDGSIQSINNKEPDMKPLLRSSVISDPEQTIKTLPNMPNFNEYIKHLKSTTNAKAARSFVDIVRERLQWNDKLPKETTKLILECLEQSS